MVISVANKALNDTTGKNGKVPSGIGFRTLPKFSTVCTDLLQKKELMESLATCQEEVVSGLQQGKR